MDTNMDRLLGKLRELKITQEEAAKAIGISYSTFHRKIQADGLPFTIGEMHRLAFVLSLNSHEAASIFLGQNSHKCENCAPLT